MIRIRVREPSDQWVVMEMVRMAAPDGRPPTSVESKVGLSMDFALLPSR